MIEADNITPKSKIGRPSKYATEDERKQAIDQSVKKAKKKYYMKNMALIAEYKMLQEQAAAIGIRIGAAN